MKIIQMHLGIFFFFGLTAGLELGLQFSEQPQDCVVSRNKPAALHCSSPGRNVTFSWTLDNRPLPLADNPRIQLLPNGTLYFKKVYHKKSGHGQSDQGVYRCIIRSSLGALISQPAHLRLASMSHEFTEGSRNVSVSVVEADPIQLPCSIESQPPAEITWVRDSTELPPSERYITLDNGTLLINQVEKDDEGNYSCLAVNSLMNKTRTGGVTQLSVESRSRPSPLEILRPANQIVNWTLGRRVQLACVARGSPTPDVKWTKLLKDQSSTLVTNATKGVSILSIDSVMTDDVGVYTCVASQVISEKKTNTVSITKEITVQNILRPPVVTKGPLSQEMPAAKLVRFHCEVDGYPPPEVVWYRDGHKLSINGRIKLRKELLFSTTVSNDSGVYQCVASNSEGSTWAAARLLVNVSRARPRPPAHLSCKPLSPSAVHLTWSQDSSAGLKAFTIHSLPTKGGEERALVKEMSAGYNQTFIVDKLPPYTNITFYVRSYNTVSASDNSDEVICQTDESVPEGIPEVTLTPQSAMTLLVSWMPLPSSVARGAITEHKVQWRRRHNPSINVETVPGDVTSYTITGLQPDTQYEVRVLAATHKGWPSLPEKRMPWSGVITPSLAALTSLLPPPTVQLTVINATTIQARWTLVSDSERVDGYHLFYRRHNGQTTGPFDLPANTTEYLLLGLEPQTWYEVQVKGVSGDQEGELGVRGIHTLPPRHHDSPAPALAPPTSLEAIPTSPHSIKLTWTPPLVPINVSYYTVSYAIVSTNVDEDLNNTKFIHSTSNSVQVTGLKVNTLYELKVRTHDDNNRHSEYSQILECSTLEDVPERVRDIQWTPLNTTSVRILWKEPNVTNGQIIGYTISYSRRSDLPLERWNNLTLRSTKPAADLSGLSPNIKYSMVIRAATSAGLGNASQPLEIYIPTRDRPYASNVPTSAHPPPPDNKDQFLGIVLGCAIGGCCVLLCTATLLYRRQCAKPHGQCRSNAANGAACFHAAPEHHEMQCVSGQLDAKGGNANGELNGLKLPLLSNGRLPNGVINKDRNVRITENPQFECGVTVSCEELRQPSDEGDSLLSGHSLNDTQLTSVTVTHAAALAPSSVADKHEPDDGFHESHQPCVGPNG